MNILEKIMGMFGKKSPSMPDLSQVTDLKQQAGDLLEKHEEQINSITDKIPGQADDQLVDKAKEVLK